MGSSASCTEETERRRVRTSVYCQRHALIELSSCAQLHPVPPEDRLPWYMGQFEVFYGGFTRDTVDHMTSLGLHRTVWWCAEAWNYYFPLQAEEAHSFADYHAFYLARWLPAYRAWIQRPSSNPMIALPPSS
jgi:hypothetical protein